MFEYLIIYFSAVIVGVVVAVVELLSRYGKGNKPEWVLWGYPQGIYYAINGLAAGIGLFASEALQKTNIVALFATSPGLAMLQASLVGFAAMFALRSSLFAIDGRANRPKVDVGPAQILNVFNQYLDRQIDKPRGASALVEVISFMDGVDSEAIYPDVLLVCLTLQEAIPQAEVEALKRKLELLKSSKDFINPKAKALAMCLEIQKDVGTDILRMVINSIQALSTRTAGSPKGLSVDEDGGEGKGRLQDSSQGTTGAVQLLDNELTAELIKLSPQGKGDPK
ncbi:MAG: hypothetical protein Q8N74_01810 [Sulfuricella sp.]|nr:hypothetical protein [Sulfuricella sp.]